MGAEKYFDWVVLTRFLLGPGSVLCCFDGQVTVKGCMIDPVQRSLGWSFPVILGLYQRISWDKVCEYRALQCVYATINFLFFFKTGKWRVVPTGRGGSLLSCMTTFSLKSGK